MIFSLIKRNIKLYYRDKAGVAFSMLGPVIMFVLYIIFLGSVQSDALKDVLPGVSADDINKFAVTWVFAGILTIVTATTSLAAIQVFVADKASGRFKDFAVSPISSSKIVFAYLVSTMIISLFMTTVVFAFSEAYIAATGGQVISPENALITFGILALLCAVFSAINSFLVTFIKSLAAFSSFSVIIGTVSGFLAAVYVPVGTLPIAVDNVINALPFSQGAALVRGPFVDKDINAITAGNSELYTNISEHFGFVLKIGDYTIPESTLYFTMIGIIVVFTVLAIMRIHRQLK